MVIVKLAVGGEFFPGDCIETGALAGQATGGCPSGFGGDRVDFAPRAETFARWWPVQKDPITNTRRWTRRLLVAIDRLTGGKGGVQWLGRFSGKGEPQMVGEGFKAKAT